MTRLAMGWMLILATLASPAFAFQDTAIEPEQGRAADAMIWRLEEGQKFKVEFSTQANIDTQVDTRIRKVEVETLLVLDWEVAEVKPKATVIKQVLKKLS